MLKGTKRRSRATKLNWPFQLSHLWKSFETCLIHHSNKVRGLQFDWLLDIRNGIDAQGEFERLRNLEKELNLEIKRINDEYKSAQDTYAKEAMDNNQDILKLKKQVNETKTEAELYV